MKTLQLASSMANLSSVPFRTDGSAFTSATAASIAAFADLPTTESCVKMAPTWTTAAGGGGGFPPQRTRRGPTRQRAKSRGSSTAARRRLISGGGGGGSSDTGAPARLWSEREASDGGGKRPVESRQTSSGGKLAGKMRRGRPTRNTKALSSEEQCRGLGLGRVWHMLGHCRASRGLPLTNEARRDEKRKWREKLRRNNGGTA